MISRYFPSFYYEKFVISAVFDIFIRKTIQPHIDPMSEIIFLAFANSPIDPLSYLEEEERNIRMALENVSEQIRVESHKDVDARKIFEHFKIFRENYDHLRIFHYSGHANPESLSLDDEVVFTDGLIEFFKSQVSAPDLVVLNGCSTHDEERVPKLIKAGVKHVITTTRDVEDRAAMEFATHFYESLALRADVRLAYDEAISYLIFKGYLENPSEPQVKRGILSREVARRENSNRRDQIWGFYSAEESKGRYWSVPSRENPVPNALVDQEIYEKMNDLLVYPLMEEIMQLSVEGYESPRGHYEATIRQHVVQAFPSPIGKEIEVLFQAKRSLESQIKQALIIYVRMAKFFCFTLLSQWWDELDEELHRSTESAILEKIQPKDRATLTWLIAKLLKSQTPEGLPFDYTAMSTILMKIFRQVGIRPFEAWAFPQEKNKQRWEKYLKASQRLHILRTRLLNQSNVNEIRADFDLFETVLKELKVILHWHAYLVNYELISVKEIILQKIRKRNVIYYDHEMAILQKISDDHRFSIETFLEHTETHSIILKRRREYIEQRFVPETDINQNEQESLHKKLIDHCLNLSPFIIDKNANLKKGTLSEVLIFSGIDQDCPSLSKEQVKDWIFNYTDTQQKGDLQDLASITIDKDYASPSSKKVLTFLQPTPRSGIYNDLKGNLHAQLSYQFEQFYKDFHLSCL